ncbi:polysaccharide biosynthesis tyrosine autokinase [Agromyces sp. NPDC049794]|uniref:polysaccharide biosynthesis tyrosine autokinase n=1 Tax=unclassified Agromyces TaxID=2639701 RepID=UPI0033DDB544
MTVVGVGAGYGWTLLQTPVYVAGASGYLSSTGVEDLGTSTLGDSLARSKVPTYLEIAEWRTVADHAIEELGLDTTPEQLVNRIEVSNPPETTFIRVDAQGPSPETARELAEAWIDAMKIQIDEIEGDGSPGSAPVTILPGDVASLPSSPSFPDVQTAVIVGGILGLGFGIAFAMIRTVSDRRIRAGDDVEQRTGVAVVGTIPIVPGLDHETRLIDPATSGSTGKNGTFAVSEALRALRTNLQFMDVDHPPKTIVVTSPLPGDGKSTVACNLALTLAAAGSTVVLVDGDLRRSMVAKTMGLPGGAGLSDVLAGRASLVEVLQRTPRSSNLLVLAAGSVPPNPSEVLGSERMHALIADLSKHATVIIDAPPLLPVTDGAVLTHQADGALIVITLRKTTFDLLDKALDTLHKARGRALGVVLNRAPLRGADAAAYSYEYRRDYTPSETKAEALPAEPPTPAVARPDADSYPDAPVSETPAASRRAGGRRS